MKKTILLLALLALTLPYVAGAASVDTDSLPNTDDFSGSEWTLERVDALIQQIADFIIGIALIAAVVFIIWGGIKYMMAGADEGKAGEAKTMITNGIIGAAVVLAVGVILKTVGGIVSGNFFGV